MRTSSLPTTHASTTPSSTGSSQPTAPPPGHARDTRCRGTPSRMLTDTETGVWFLTQTLPSTDRTVFAALSETAATPMVRVWATSAAFEAKDELRTRGYRWMPADRDGIPRSWWPGVAPSDLESEFDWLADVCRTRSLARRSARVQHVTHNLDEAGHAIPRETRIIEKQAERAARPRARDRALVPGARTRRVPRPNRDHSRPHRGHPRADRPSTPNMTVHDLTAPRRNRHTPGRISVAPERQ